MDVSEEHVKMKRGDVQDTMLIPDKLLQKILILRLDTDFYASTKIELEKLFPSVSKRGIAVLDDYGYWQGQRKACDEYFAKFNLRLFFTYSDNGTRKIVKGSLITGL